MADVLCPVVVGRTHELHVLHAALAEARAGHGSVAFVVGEAGIGKSRLAREVATAAGTLGCRVLRGRAVPGAAEVAFRPLTEALGEAIGAGPIPHEDELTPWLPALAAMLPGLGQPAIGPADDTAPVRGEAVIRLLQSLVAPPGALLILEDLHWADPETIAVLEHLVDHLDRASVLCIATVRVDEPSAARDLARAVASRRSAPVLALNRLSDVQVAAMVHACTDGTDDDIVRRVTDAADGVPFLVEELLTSPGVPTTFAETVQRRLDALPDDARAAIVMASVIGRQFDWRILAAATGVPEGRVSEALELAVRAQLLAIDGNDFRFRHALTRDAVVETLSPPRREALAAAALHATEAAHPTLDGGWHAVAAQLAEQAGQLTRAIGLLTEIGARTLERGNLRSAIGAFERARELLPNGTHDELDAHLVDAYALAGRVDDAFSVGAPLAHRLRDAGAPADAATLHLRLARAAISAGRWAVAERQLSHAHELIGVDDDSRLARLAVLEAELALDTGDPVRAAERATAARRTADLDTIADVACEALLLQGRCERLISLERAYPVFAEALAIAEAHDMPMWRLRALHELGTISMLDRADLRDLYAARVLAEELGALSTVAVLDLELGAGASLAGDAESMLAHADAAGALGRQLDLGLVITSAHVWRAMAVAMYGDRESVENSLAAAAATSDYNDALRALGLLGVNAVCALALDDRVTARAAIDEAMSLLRAQSTTPPAVYRGLWPLVAAVDHDEAVGAILEEFTATDAMVSRGNRGYVCYTLAVLAGRSTGDPMAEFVRGEDELRHNPYWRHLGRRLVAEAAMADGWGEPARWLRESEDWFRSHGFDALAASCARLRQPTDDGPPPHWARFGVTSRELDVLELVATGLPNKEIASALGISARTVEKHVESLLRKTGARSRTQLVALSRPTPDAPGTPRH